jgi:putative sporulation protein YtaF
MGISLKFSEILGHFISAEFFETAGLIILIVIGMASIFKSFIRSLVRRISSGGGDPLKMCGFGFCINIYLDETAADLDSSKVLSVQEAAVLALASSMDAAAMGLNFGYSGINALAAGLFTMLAGYAAVLLGGFTGKKNSSLRHDFSWVGGILLIIFALVTYIV